MQTKFGSPKIYFLSGVEEFIYNWIIFQFNQNIFYSKPTETQPSWIKFAKIVKINGFRVHLGSLDLINKTQILDLDIKPFIQRLFSEKNFVVEATDASQNTEGVQVPALCISLLHTESRPRSEHIDRISANFGTF